MTLIPAVHVSDEHSDNRPGGGDHKSQLSYSANAHDAALGASSLSRRSAPNSAHAAPVPRCPVCLRQDLQPSQLPVVFSYCPSVWYATSASVVRSSPGVDW